MPSLQGTQQILGGTGPLQAVSSPTPVSAIPPSAFVVLYIYAWTGAMTETIATTDSPNRLLTAGRALAAEGTTTTSSLAGKSGFSRAASETISTLDAVARGAIGFLRAATETANTAASPARFLAALRGLTETQNTTDQTTLKSSFGRSATEVILTGDQAARILARVRAVTETNATSGALARSAIAFLRTPNTETLNTLDTLTRQTASHRTLSPEGQTAADSLLRILTRIRSATETTSTADAPVTRSVSAYRMLTEAIATSDAANRALRLFRSIATEVVNTTDSVTAIIPQIQHYAVSIAETISSVASLQVITGFSRASTESNIAQDATARRTALSRAESESIPTTTALKRYIFSIHTAVVNLVSAAVTLLFPSTTVTYTLMATDSLVTSVTVTDSL